MPIGLSEATYGQLSTFVRPHAVVVGTSIANYSDGANASAANQDSATDNGVRWGWVSGNRYMPLWKIPLTFLPRRVEIAEATLRVPFGGRNTTTTGAMALEVHEIEGELAAGTTFLLRATGTNWYNSGYGPAPAYDYNAVAAGSASLTSGQVASITAGGDGDTPGIVVEFDVTAAVQRRRDAGSDLQLIMPVTWPSALAWFMLRYSDNAAIQNVELRVRYWPALGILSADEAAAGRPPDFTKLHNPALAGNAYRSWLDVVEQGTTSSTIKLWGWNFRRSGIRRDVVIGTSLSETTTVDSSASVSGITLRSIDVYNKATGEVTPSGDVTVKAISGTTYSVDYTDPTGVTVTLAEETTGLTVVTFAADHIFVLSGARVLKIRTLKWSATTGANTADRWRCSLRGDQRTTQSVDTLSLVALVPRDDGDQDASETSRARFLSHAFTQQIRAAAANVTISGTSRGHLQVRDTSNINWATGANACVDIFTPGGTFVTRDMKIATVYPSTDGTYPDTLRFDRDFTAPELAAFSALTTTVTGGIYLGDFAKNTVRRVATGGVVAGSGTLPLDSAFDIGTPARVEIVATDGTHEQVDVLSGSGTLTLATNLANTYPGGALVFVVLDPANPTDLAAMAGRPYYLEGVVPNTEPEGLYTGYCQIFEQKVI